MIQKKGEENNMTTTLFVVIASIAAFIIIIFFLVRSDIIRSQSVDKLCELSVLNRATVPESANNLIPLECTTKKICLDGSQGCNEFIGEEQVTSLKLPLNENEAKNKIEQAYATEMYNCWQMMGEGKLDLFSGGIAKTAGAQGLKRTCVICSRIALSEDKKQLFSKINLQEYLKNNQVPGSSQTYLKTFTDSSTNTYSSTKDLDKGMQDTIKDEEVDTINYNIQTTEMAVIFTQIKPQDYLDTLNTLRNLGVTAAGATFLTPGVKTLAGKFITTPIGLGITVAGATGVTIFSLATTYENKVAAAGYCGELTTQESAKKHGCSTVQIVPYDYQTLNKLCPVIEGNP